MKKLLNLKSLIGLGLISIGLLLPLSASHNAIELNITKPEAQVIEIVKPISNLITDRNDRIKLAVFNQEFANRVTAYNTDIQQVNDVYVLAAAIFFSDSLNDKYKNLDTLIIDLIKKSVTDDNHQLSLEEKNSLSNNFMGLAWTLVN
jgi:hypothetical protein